MPAESEIATLRNGTKVAAWLLKANPAVWDVVPALQNRESEALGWWRMAPSYRVDLVHIGHPCVLWVTGGRHSPHTGVWATGTITSEPYLDVGDSSDSRWVDLSTRDHVRPYISIDLDVLSSPVRLLHLLDDPRFDSAEICRAPRVASPGALTTEEFAAIEDAVQFGRAH